MAPEDQVRLRRARAALWLGAFMPIIYTVGKGVNDVGGVGPLELLRGGGGLALYALVFMIRPPKVRSLRNGIAEAGLIFFVVIAALSCFWSVDAKTTLLKLVPLVVTYLCLAKLATLYGSVQETVCAVVTVAHMILIGTLVQLVIWPDRAYSTDTVGEDPRIHSLLPAIASNLFGLVAAIGIAGVCLTIGPRWTARAPWNVVLVCVYFVLLLGTRSRVVTAVALIIMLVCLFRVMHRSQNANIIGWFATAGIVATSWWITTRDDVWGLVVDFVVRGQDAQGLTTLTGRTVVWERVLPLIREDQWWGLGYYSGHRIGLPLRDSLFRNYSNLDNTWLESVVGVGIIGTTGLVVFLAFGVVRSIRATARMGHYRLLSTLLVIGVAWLTLINPTVQANTSTLVFFALIVFSTRRGDAEHLATWSLHESAPAKSTDLRREQ
ncbi:O-antigen ligase family protein [Rhodococcus jostii]|nr:O-antigen ligase family protein [Rhodococcus jostii]